MTDTAHPVITVAICSYNRAAHLATALAAVNAQTTSVPFEVLVIDDASSDDTSSVATTLGARVVRHEENRGVSIARQTALENAAGEFIAFTDDDCVPTPEWLENLWAAQSAHPDAGCWGGRTFPGPCRTLVDRYSLRNNPFEPLGLELETSDQPLYRLGLYLRGLVSLRDSKAGPVFSFPTGNLLTRVADAKAIGGFDPRFQNAGEDEDFARRMRERGRTLWYAPEAIVHHAPVSTVRRMVQRSLLYGWGNAAAFCTGRSATPTIYPTPLLLSVAAPLTLAVLRRRGRGPAALAAAATLGAPLAAYPRWARHAFATKKGEPLSYAYLQALQEGAGNAGWLWYAKDQAKKRLTRPAPALPTE